MNLIKKVTLVALILLSQLSAEAQLDSSKLDSTIVDSLISSYILSYDPFGSVVFKDSSLKTGELFTIFSSYLADTSNSFVLLSSSIDREIGNLHTRYEQNYLDIPVDGAEIFEHSKDGYTYRIEGKYANPTGDTSDMISKFEAIHYLDQYSGWTGEEKWPWLNSDWEQALKDESGNQDTTYYPVASAKLIWAVHNYKTPSYEIPDSCLRLSWRFELMSLDPLFIRHYFVDAFTGEVFDYDNLISTDGPADILNYGSQYIDTKSRGWPNNDYILRADGLDRNVHTKKYFGNGSTSNVQGEPFSLAPNITDGDDDWGSNNQNETTSHWLTVQAWDYFDNQYGRSGFKGNGNKVKVRASAPDEPDMTYQTGQTIVIGSIFGGYAGVLDIVGHEFAHGVIKKTANLKYKRESGALHESFADIFGVMVEDYAESLFGFSNWDWEMGEDILEDWRIRDMEFPSSAGTHYDPNIVPCAYAASLGQPSIYEGEFWYDEEDRSETDQCDEYGVHVNSGVQNKWFQLLADGGTHNNVSVVGIGIYNASNIAYYALTNSLGKNSQYINSRIATINAAIDIYGVCSIESQSVSDAWDAVEVPGIAVWCFPQGTQHRGLEKFDMNIFPNPSNGVFSLKTTIPIFGSIEIYSIQGQRISQINVDNKNEVLINVSLPAGVYFLKVINNDKTYAKRFVVR